jgi:hypothetical protein
LENADKNFMFDFVDTRFQRFQRIILINGNDLCSEHGTVVHAVIGDEMNHDARVINVAALKCIISALDGVRAGKYPRQGRVKIDDAIGKA